MTERELLEASARALAAIPADRLQQECDTIAELNHAQWLALGKAGLLVAACNRLSAESEEFDFDDGLGRGVQQAYWDEFESALEQATEAIDVTNKTTHQIHVAPIAQQAGGVPAGWAAWENSEGWESLAWELCADENGEEACNELIWEGGPVPEPWGERWLKYEDEAKRLIKLVHKHAAAPSPSAVQPLSEAQIVKCLVESGCIGKVAMSFESGPYDITRPSINADRLVRAVEAAHGIKDGT